SWGRFGIGLSAPGEGACSGEGEEANYQFAPRAAGTVAARRSHRFSRLIPLTGIGGPDSITLSLASREAPCRRPPAPLPGGRSQAGATLTSLCLTRQARSIPQVSEGSAWRSYR